MFETFQGLPIHVLVIHAVVVGVPVAALVTVVVAFLPSLRARFAWAVVVLNALMVAATYVAQESGKWFYDSFEQLPPAAADHRELGLLMIWFVLGLFVASVLVALLANRAGLLVVLVAVLALGAAGAATVQTALTGHSGSKAVWEGIVN